MMHLHGYSNMKYYKTKSFHWNLWRENNDIWEYYSKWQSNWFKFGYKPADAIEIHPDDVFLEMLG